MVVKVVVAVATLVVGFLGGMEVHQYVAASDEPRPTDRAIDPSAHNSEVVHEDCPTLDDAAPYPVNDHGMTFGSGSGIDAQDPGPDLIAAYGTNGRCGFIRASDRDDGPRTLAQARGTKTDSGRSIALYAQDGVTVIGEVHIGGGP